MQTDLITFQKRLNHEKLRYSFFFHVIALSIWGFSRTVAYSLMVEIFAGTYFRAADVREVVLIFAGIYFRAKWKNG